MVLSSFIFAYSFIIKYLSGHELNKCFFTLHYIYLSANKQTVFKRRPMLICLKKNVLYAMAGSSLASIAQSDRLNEVVSYLMVLLIPE